MTNQEHMTNPRDAHIQAWEAQEPIVAEFETLGAKKFFDKITETEAAFTDRKERLSCIDEGAANMEGAEAWHLAGSGILYPANSWEERLTRIAAIATELGITEITNHEGCGAAGLAWHRDGEAAGTGCQTADEYGRKWAEVLLAEITIQKNALPAHHREIKLSEMARPASFHDARVVWFDATGTFNPSALGKEIPKGFVVDYGNAERFANSDEERQYAFTELEVAISIALGDHGFGARFSEDHPFIVAVLASDADELQRLTKYLKDRLSKYGERVRIDGTVQPTSETKKAAT